MRKEAAEINLLKLCVWIIFPAINKNIFIHIKILDLQLLDHLMCHLVNNAFIFLKKLCDFKIAITEKRHFTEGYKRLLEDVSQYENYKQISKCSLFYSIFQYKQFQNSI